MTFECAAWLVIARGGWWTNEEVRVELADRFDMATPVVACRLWIMANRRHFLKRRAGVAGAKGSASYAVTPGCRLPMGLTVGEIVQAVGAA
jgi:hypothetical protein